MKNFVIILGLLVSQSAFSNSFWSDVSGDSGSQLLFKTPHNNKITQKLLKSQPMKRRSLTLNEREFRKLLLSETGVFSLSQKKKDSSDQSHTNYQTEVDLPLPNGGFVRVKVFESPILSPDIAEQYPEINTWRVEGVKNPEISGRLDFTTNGFHGMLNMPDGDTVYIDPDEDNTSELYHSLSKLENISHFHTEFNCHVHDHHSLIKKSENDELAAKKLAQIPVQDLITYRLAIAGTAEYTASQNGTPSSAYASMVTTINRVNDIYQRDLGVKLEIVSGNNFAYTNAFSDPYTNNNAAALISENIVNLNNNFGSSNYDIGHVFAQGRLGGLAYVGATCISDYKAGGATGIIDPQGEVFAIEFVAHEMGHQLGATHTFNSEQRACGNGNRTAATAVEPGSGSTIMSYSGLCGTDDIQYSSDAMFHWVSIDQINNYTRTDTGNSCGTRRSQGSENPVAEAGEDSIIPRNTPFFLEGSATDGLTYTWDQIDVGSISPVDIDVANNAIIRSLLPSTSLSRYIPKLSDLFAGTQTIGEILPQTTRDLNFTFVVRNNNGGIDSDLKTISVRDTGSHFRVLSQSSSEILATGDTVDIAWIVAGTNTTPINCSKVDIQLIRENGIKNMLLANTDNDGAQQLIIPSNTPLMTNARIMVACNNQPFFQVSSGNITIEQGSNGADTTAPIITIIGLPTVSLVRGASYIDEGATALDNIDGEVTVIVTGSVDNTTVGTYSITYTATDSSGNTATAVRIVQVTSVVDITPPVITLIGASYLEVIKGSTYTDAGATATDDTDAVVSVSTSGQVNTATAGTYTIIYSATDTSGNTSTKTRTVEVIQQNTGADTIPPVISLAGNSTITLTIGDNYTEPGFSALDNRDGTVSVSVTGTVNTNKVGTYVLTYSASDAAGNIASKIRTVIISQDTNVDTVPPVITLQGNSIITLRVGQVYNDPGFSAYDNHDGAVSVIVSGAVNTSKVGTYTLTYTASDAAGNFISKMRIIKVISAVTPDTDAPVITLLGSLSVTLTEGDIFTEPGFSALDTIDGNITVSVTGTVDTNKPGTYVLTYSATDSSGNNATLNRTIIILKKNNGQHNGGSSKGGTIGFLLLPFVLIGYRRILKDIRLID